MWGGWFLVTAAVFSFMSGIIHTYYAVALAPAIGALVGAGVVELWRLRARSTLAALVLAGGNRRNRDLGSRAAEPDARRSCPGRTS